MELYEVGTGDLGRLRALADAYWDELMPSADTVSTPERRDAYFAERFAGAADSQTFFGIVDGREVGFVRLLHTGPGKGTISDFYVGSSHRRQGHGTCMLECALARLDARVVDEVTLTVRRDNPGALRFWQRQGFVVGHHDLRQFRDPAAGTAWYGALSSDFDDRCVGYEFVEVDTVLRQVIAEQWDTQEADRLRLPDDGFSIAADTDNRIVGAVSVSWGDLPQPLPPTREAYIQSIRVAAEHRRRGIGSRLVELAERRARDEGLYQVRAWSTDDKTAAIALWGKLGYALCPATHVMWGPQVSGYFVAKVL